MIISENPKPDILEFSLLMSQTDKYLNKIAEENEDYFIGHSGIKLEKDVFEAVKKCAVGTSFDGSIQLISGVSFPDIVAHKFYGVEVKSTEKNHWTSIGSSILESTRIKDVERIYLTFGKLGKPSKFLSRPYEDCLSEIVVTHYPRYRIDMQLKAGDTIFDKMGVPYDELRKMENPVVPVSKYYKENLKEGESLWWTGTDVESTVSSPILRLWNTLPGNFREDKITEGYVLFPELLSGQYEGFVLWLASQGIIIPNARDLFSAGGQKTLPCFKKGKKFPAVYKRVYNLRDGISDFIEKSDAGDLLKYWLNDDAIDVYMDRMDTLSEKLSLWIDIACYYNENESSYKILNKIFDSYLE